MADLDRERLVRVEDLVLGPGVSARDLVERMYRGGGFTAKKVGVAADVLRRMRADGVTMILSFPADLVATGLRGVLAQMVREGAVDAIVTTCGTLDHDLARTWRDYYHGEFGMDDRALHRAGVNRLGNVLVPNESYGEILEEKLRPWIDAMGEKKPRWSTAEICRELGERLRSEPNSEGSILRACAERGVPVFVPGITDGAVGSQLWMRWQRQKDFQIDLFADEQALADLVFDADTLGALMLGGGISKHHVIWWSQFRDGLDLAVYVTTAVEWDGSLSGARLEEAISWGKVKEDATFANVEGDATVILPLLWAAARE